MDDRADDRRQAGRALADEVRRFADLRPIVIGLPKGGVPIAFEVARALEAPLDVLVVSKLRAPRQPSFAIGATAEGGTCVVNEPLARILGVSDEELAHVKGRARDDLSSSVLGLRTEFPALDVHGRAVLMIDDALITGATAAVAARVLKARGAVRVILASPQATDEGVETVRFEVDDLVLLDEPSPRNAVHGGLHDLETSQEEVRRLLAESRRAETVSHREVEIAAGDLALPGELSIPIDPLGVVVFAHGSGSSRHSPRNLRVARRMNEEGLATLLFDLLSPLEAEDRSSVFDIPLLAGRLAAGTDWVRARADVGRLPVGYFGASTGAAAALWAAAEPRTGIAAIVSRGGRPDLASSRLAGVEAPTLFIVGGADEVVRDLNVSAARRMRCDQRLEVIPGATHLFEEPGALERVADLAASWFSRLLGRASNVA